MQMPEGAIEQKTCNKCKAIFYGEDVRDAFRVTSRDLGRAIARPRLRATCVSCEQDIRDVKKNKNPHSRWKVKARNTRRNHSRKLGIPQKILEEEYGWNLDIMAHEAAHQFENGCSECHQSYKEMEHGMEGARVITLDIRDRSLGPDMGGNVSWICLTCNQAKGTMSTEDWTTRKRIRRISLIASAKLQEIPKAEQLKLFNVYE